MADARILVVEDEGVTALDIKNRLESLGYSVVGIASSGEEAVRHAKKTLPDLVLMDIVLRNGMNGIAAAQQIAELVNVPVVYLTAYGDDSTWLQAKATQPFAYLLKPFSGRELHIAIEIALEKNRMEEALRAINQQLEQRVRELTALNSTFQEHLAEYYLMVDESAKLQPAAKEVLDRMQALANALCRLARHSQTMNASEER